MTIGVVSHLFPTLRNPSAGIFVKNQIDHLSRYADIRLFAPYPNQSWLIKGKTPTTGFLYPVERPFMLAFPRFFMQRLYPSSMAWTIRKHRVFFDGCDIIHAHNAFPDGVAAVKAFHRNLPVIVTVHGSDVNLFAMKKNLQPLIVESLNKAGTIVCVSGSLASKLRSIGVIARLAVIPNGVDTDLFSSGDRTGACLSLGLDPERPRLIFIGNFNPNKGIEYLIRAMPHVLKRIPDCELIIIGARPNTRDITLYDGLIRETGIQNNVRLHTILPHHDLPRWIAASDALVLPSVKEGFGLVAAEALACGRPVIATRSGGPEEIVREGEGVLVPVKDSRALADGILNILDGTGIFNAHALAASARERFSFDRICKILMGIYKDNLH